VLFSTLMSGFLLREGFLRARFYPFEWVLGMRGLLACSFLPFEWVWGSRGLLACSFPSFCAGFGFARTSCVFVFTLLSGFWVRENFFCARFPTKKHVNGQQGRAFVSALMIIKTKEEDST
jgi:hypothetical protein